MSDPDLNSVVMALEDHGLAPVGGEVDFEKVKEARDELNEWIEAHEGCDA